MLHRVEGDRLQHGVLAAGHQEVSVLLQSRFQRDCIFQVS